MATISGGDKLVERLREIAANVKGGAKVRVGFLEGATYPDGTSVALVAAINEFGAPNAGIPPRPFFRHTIADHAHEWPEAVSSLLKANDYDSIKTLGMAGEAIAGQLRQGIVDTNSPPLAEATVERKGSSKPLVDTGHLLASVDYEVKSG